MNKKLRVAIIGTRGIPNHYGGFEQFAEYLAKELVVRGHLITVYNSHIHPYKDKVWKGVKLIHQYDPEDKIGTAGQFIYDFNCIKDLKKHNFDIILQLGYTSNSIWHKLLPKKPVIITNMDGLEWKRSKYNKFTQRFLKYAESLAAYNSDVLIADSVGIKNHIKETYGLSSIYIPYGADLFRNPDERVITEYGLAPYDYNILIARMEPENNIEIIIKGHKESNTKTKLILIGNINNKFAEHLKLKYQNDNMIFLGGIYNRQKLDNLRYFSNIYFHGHSVGGTNPSLLEAMASSCIICANDNIFNKSILEENSLYFSKPMDIVNLLTAKTNKSNYTTHIGKNVRKITEKYSWDRIVDQYEEVFIRASKKNK